MLRALFGRPARPPAMSAIRQLELAHAVMDRKRSAQEHSRLVSKICGESSASGLAAAKDDAFGAMARDMRAKPRKRHNGSGPKP